MIAWFKKILFRTPQKASAHLARERLMVIVAHERGQHEAQPDFLPMLQKEITEVIAKYVKVNQDQVHVDFEQKGGRSILELNITFPDAAVIKEAPPHLTQAKVSHSKKMPQPKKNQGSKK